MTRRLLILACSGRKRFDDGRLAAIERYNGPLWQTLRAADPHSDRAEVAFLSAFYGIGPSHTPLPHYDYRMTVERSRTMMRDQLMPALLPAILAGASGVDQRPFDELCFAGGWMYLEVLRAWRPHFEAAGLIAGGSPVTEINAPIGIMRQQLRAWLDA